MRLQKILFPLNLQLFAEGDPDPKPEPKKDQVETKKESTTIQQLTKRITELETNSVPLEDYNKVVEENHELTKAIIDGSSSRVKKSNQTPAKKPTLKELAMACSEGGLSNLEMAKRELAYREVYMEKYGRDPFAPNANVTSADIKKAQEIADTMAECIEQAQGDPEMFNAIFNSRITKDDPVLEAKLNLKKYK